MPVLHVTWCLSWAHWLAVVFPWLLVPRETWLWPTDCWGHMCSNCFPSWEAIEHLHKKSGRWLCPIGCWGSMYSNCFPNQYMKRCLHSNCFQAGEAIGVNVLVCVPPPPVAPGVLAMLCPRAGTPLSAGVTWSACAFGSSFPVVVWILLGWLWQPDSKCGRHCKHTYIAAKFVVGTP